MSLPPSFFDHLSDRLELARYDIAQELRAQRLKALYEELMKIRITEPTFWDGKSLKPGDEIDAQVINGITIGPFRTEVQPGGLRKINQFVEMAEELPPSATAISSEQVKPQPPVAAVPPSASPPPASFAEATASIAKPAAPAVKGNPLAARIRAVTSRQAKFQDLATSLLGPIEQQMTEIETVGPAALKKATETGQDQLNSLTDLADAFKEMGNGPLQGS